MYNKNNYYTYKKSMCKIKIIIMYVKDLHVK